MASISAADSEGVLLTGSSLGSPTASVSARGAAGDGLEVLVTRKMYDAGTILTYCPSLAELSAGARASMNPETAGQIGVSAGDEVTVSGNGGDVSLEVVVDAGVAPQSIAIEFNQPNASATRLLDVSRIVSAVSVEAVS